MKNLKEKVSNFMNDEDGLTVVEYAIAGGLVGAGVIVAFGNLGETVNTIIEYIDTELGAAPAAGGGG